MDNPKEIFYKKIYDDKGNFKYLVIEQLQQNGEIGRIKISFSGQGSHRSPWRWEEMKKVIELLVGQVKEEQRLALLAYAGERELNNE